MSKRKNTPEERLSTVQDYLSGKGGVAQICQDLKLKNHQNIKEWVWLYQEHGEEAFVAREGNKSYLEQIKITAVEEYLSAGGSARRKEAFSICRANRKEPDKEKTRAASIAVRIESE